MFNHVSVMLNEAVEGLNIRPDGIYVDCTLGGAGHSSEILKRLTTGHLYCFDQDETAIAAAKERLEKVGHQFTIIRSNFKNIDSELMRYGVDKVDGILFDLGVSSPQFDEGYRGFSYNHDAYLDMRMDRRQTLTAADVVNRYSEDKLIDIFRDYGEINIGIARALARMIVLRRRKQRFDSTNDLAEAIRIKIGELDHGKYHKVQK